MKIAHGLSIHFSGVLNSGTCFEFSHEFLITLKYPSSVWTSFTIFTSNIDVKSCRQRDVPVHQTIEPSVSILLNLNLQDFAMTFRYSFMHGVLSIVEILCCINRFYKTIFIIRGVHILVDSLSLSLKSLQSSGWQIPLEVC